MEMLSYRLVNRGCQEHPPPAPPALHPPRPPPSLGLRSTRTFTALLGRSSRLGSDWSVSTPVSQKLRLQEAIGYLQGIQKGPAFPPRRAAWRSPFGHASGYNLYQGWVAFLPESLRVVILSYHPWLNLTVRSLRRQEFVFLSFNSYTDPICVIHTEGADTELKVKIWGAGGGRWLKEQSVHCK